MFLIVPVAHKVYGVPQTINTANYVYFLAFQELFALGRSLPTSEDRDLHAIANGTVICFMNEVNLKLHSQLNYYRYIEVKDSKSCGVIL